MKVLCHGFTNALYYIFEGWRQVFLRTGHDWRWMNTGEAPLDVFAEYEPDIFIGATYEITRALSKAIAARPNLKVIMKANNWGPMDAEIDLVKFPIGVSNEQERQRVAELKEVTGRPDFVLNFYHINRYEGTMSYWKDKMGIGLVEGLPAADIFNYRQVPPSDFLKCDIGFAGGYWPYKAINLDRYILPFCYPVGKYNVKIVGNQPWPVPQYMGPASNHVVETLFASSTICPNISEPHANVFGFEVNERIFKLAATKAFCINDPIASLNEDIFTENELVIADDPEHFYDLVNLFLTNPQLRDVHIESCYNRVIGEHTYCHRVANVLNNLGMPDEAKKALALLEKTNVQV
jgi:spore maturation protein CgeB